MKALFISDEINQFHWSMLKSVLLVLSLLPLSQWFFDIWHSTEGSSQIMVGFMAISVFSACAIISFCSALTATLKNVELEQPRSSVEAMLVKLYGYVPMLSLAIMLSYLTTQF